MAKICRERVKLFDKYQQFSEMFLSFAKFTFQVVYVF